MRSHSLLVALGLASAVLLGGSTSAQAQAPATQRSVTLNATLNESITLTLSPGTVSFDLLTGPPALGSSPVTATLSWSLAASRTQVLLDATFTNPSAALQNGASAIPAANVYARLQGGPFNTPCTTGPNNNRCFGAAISLPQPQSTFTAAFEFGINATGLTLAPGTYGGTVLFSASAI